MPGRRNRIAVFVGHADESYQSRFIKGFLKNAFGYDMDVCVFSMYRKYQDSSAREKGESNIFSLMEPSMFDGAVILEDTIQTADAAQELEERLHESFGKPVLVIEKESRYFHSIFTDSSPAVKALVSHLIEVHGYKDIAYLSGKEWHEHSKQRLNAYREAMEEHGLEVHENRIFYGDFWYKSGELCADHLAADKNGLPEAVVCANDAMAVGLGKAFADRGIKVPDDVAIVSYDSTDEGQTSPSTITSSLIPAEEFGNYAADFMHDSLIGKETPPFEAEPGLLIGESCGCKKTNMPDLSKRREKWETEISEEGFDSINNTMAENLMSQTDLTGFLSAVYSYAYQIKGAESFDLCIANVWKYMDRDSDLSVPNNGYPSKLIHAVGYNSDRKDGTVGLEKTFDRSELLPRLSDERETPAAFFFTPVFCEKMCFGYAAVSYGNDPRSYDDIYRRWIGVVSRGLEELRRYLSAEAVREKLDKMKKSKFAAADAAYESLSEEEKSDYELVKQILDNNLLTYHFQPIVNTIDGSIYSYEALMRSNTEKRISPLSIIKYADMQNRLGDVEKATFLNVLSIVSDSRDIIGKAKVFINSIPGIRITDKDFEQVEEYLGKFSETVVVELTEEAELTDRDLEKLKGFYHRMDVEIAVDDYGTGYSNVSNLLRYMPNYVKIDRSLLSEIQNKPQKQHFVREVINFCHDNNIMALAEGVETSEELRTVIHLGADLIQGYYTARPAPEFIGQIDEKIRDEIRTYHREHIEGNPGKIYTAGKTNRIPLATLVKDGFTDIIVGRGTMVYKDLTIVGTPGARSDVHVRIEPGYSGRITLENAYFSNVKNRPCIELGENSDVTLVLEGENILHKSGIRVPGSSKLTVEGEGDLRIDLNALEYYGIGNDPDSSHGEIVFMQEGAIEIHSSGASGVCIGSGKGGIIRMNRGQYSINISSVTGVCIGSFSGDTDTVIFGCNVSIEFSATAGIGVGSFSGNSRLSISNSAFSIYGAGNSSVGVGTMSGGTSVTEIRESSPVININSERSTGVGSLNGRTEIRTTSAVLKIENSGENSLAVGGFNDDTVITMTSSDIRCKIRNKLGRCTYAKKENITIDNGRFKSVVNGDVSELF